ncbi:MAG: acetyltransferase, family [Acidobacteriaceae bacterium]|nr:acetyltransferase, family [Acidobacteriaceae bacterium]
MVSYGQMSEKFEELFEKGYRARRENRVADSRAIFLDAVRKAAEDGDRPSLAEALCGLAQAENDIGNCEAARQHYASAAVLYRQVGPPSRVAFAIRHEADLLRQMCQPSAAEPLYLEAEKIYRQQGDGAALDLANTLRGLALTREATGTLETSRPLWIEARELYTRSNVKAGVEECNRKLSS